ncbi:MAG: RDD family protein [Acidimicrobiales bacterium]
MADYEADTVTIATPEGVELDVVVAGLGSRGLAAAIDLVITQTAGVLVLLVGVAAASVAGGWAVAVAAIAAFFFQFGWFLFFEALWDGQTPGKRAAGLRVVHVDGRPIGFLTSAVRNVMRVVDLLPGLYLAGALCILFTSRHQRLGDLAAGTIVIRERRPGPLAPAAPAPLQSVGPAAAAAWDLTAISGEELAAVRAFLARRWSLDPEARARLAVALEAALRPKVVGAPPAPAEWFLEALAAARP